MKKTSIGASLLLILTGTGVTGARAQTTWAVSQQPTLVIGTVDGPPSSVFQDIRGVVMGVSTDPLGVQRVHRYHLTR
jgi:hypothetical protein